MGKAIRFFICISQIFVSSQIAFSKPFNLYCLSPESDQQRQTVLAVMIKMKVQDRLTEENCRIASQSLSEKWFLNIYPDPFEPARGPAADLSPIEDEIQLKILSVAKNQIVDLSPLAQLKNLMQLNISYNPASDISPLKNLKLLEELLASETAIKDLKPLTGLPRMRVLSLANNLIDDITPLSGLVNLKALDLSFNNITDASSLDLMSFEYLQLSANKIQHLDLSKSSDSLVLLDVSSNKLDEIIGLAHLTRADAISIADNRFVRLTDFSGLKSLRWLDIRKNKVADLSPLAGLTDLQHLLVAGNQICELPDEVAELQNEHLDSKGRWISLKISGLDDQRDCPTSL